METKLTQDQFKKEFGAFTPVVYTKAGSGDSRTFKHALIETIESYFYLGGNVCQVDNQKRAIEIK